MIKKGEITKKLALKIKLERTKRSMTQEDVAEKSGLSKQYYSGIENAKSSPTIETIALIAQAFEMKIEDLVKVDKIEL